MPSRTATQLVDPLVHADVANLITEPPGWIYTLGVPMLTPPLMVRSAEPSGYMGPIAAFDLAAFSRTEDFGGPRIPVAIISRPMGITKPLRLLRSITPIHDAFSPTRKVDPVCRAGITQPVPARVVHAAEAACSVRQFATFDGACSLRHSLPLAFIE
jgi:hypothetical protein